jgi:ethanolaminephosphotransferase
MFESVHVPHYEFIPEAVYDLAWNEWYMVYGGIVLVYNTLAR